MFCKNCGKEVSSEMSFCAKCGSKIDKVKAEGKNLKGIGGWLILVIFGLFYTLYSLGISIYSTFIMFTDGTVEQLTSVQGFSGALGFELFAQTLIFLWVVYILFLSKKEDKRFPTFYIYFLISLVVFHVIDISLISSLVYPNEEVKNAFLSGESEGYTGLVRGIVQTIVWGTYMRVSKRVKLTFIK